VFSYCKSVPALVTQASACAFSRHFSQNLHETAPERVIHFVGKLLPLWLILGFSGAAAPDARLDPVLHNVENRYNHAQSLKLDFSQTYSVSRRPAQVERGTLFLRKPGKMRWDYAAPAGKVFLSDGKNVQLYTPLNNRLEKSRLKESEDLRAPLAFLLGKLNFWKEFRSFSSRPEGDSMWVTATPNSDQLAYNSVDFLIAPDARITRVRITGQDHSILDFTFTNEQLNVPVNPSMFAFTPPPGTEIVDEKERTDTKHEAER
jgi:outer membrane lipoprotein carrier protein